VCYKPSIATTQLQNIHSGKLHFMHILCVNIVCFSGINKVLQGTWRVYIPLISLLVFCCWQQVYDIFNVSCLGVILKVRGCDGMSTPQNGAAAYSQSHVFARVVYRCLPCGSSSS